MVLPKRGRRGRRPGKASLDAVICLAGAIPIALGLYFLAAYVLDLFFFLVGTSVGSPLL